jgi:L-lysine exporter family protein LysE/ArgO
VISALATGLLTGLGLIVAIGAQNAYVLRQGLVRSHVATVVAICAASDLILILAGTAGMGAIVAAHPGLLTAFTWAGAAYLVWFGIRSLRSALSPEALSAGGGTKGSVVATTLALTWLNPHVYLDTVLMLGNLANTHGPSGRWWFAAGAGLGSIAWFSALGFGARLLAKPLARPATWRVVDTLIAVMMFALAALLVLR